jgi:hypothetical protein
MPDGFIISGPAPVKDMLDGTHPKGCTYGGFSCGYWLVADGCELEHWETHITNEDVCPCGITFPGARQSEVLFDATSPDTPDSFQESRGDS